MKLLAAIFGIFAISTATCNATTFSLKLKNFDIGKAERELIFASSEIDFILAIGENHPVTDVEVLEVRDSSPIRIKGALDSEFLSFVCCSTVTWPAILGDDPYSGIEASEYRQIDFSPGSWTEILKFYFKFSAGQIESIKSLDIGEGSNYVLDIYYEVENIVVVPDFIDFDGTVLPGSVEEFVTNELKGTADASIVLLSSTPIASVPLPAALPLMAGALSGLHLIRRRKKTP